MLIPLVTATAVSRENVSVTELRAVSPSRTNPSHKLPTARCQTTSPYNVVFSDGSYDHNDRGLADVSKTVAG
jgi:hypothetical protein